MLLVKTNVVYLNSVKKLFIDDDKESHPWLTQNSCKSPVGCPNKIKRLEGTEKKYDLNVNIASGTKVQNCFLNTIQPVSLDIIKPCSGTL